MSEVISVEAANFKAEVLESKIPVLVDFWAPWCGPCRTIAPILESLSVEYQDRVKVVKINVDDNHELASQMNVRGIPALMLFNNGEVVGSQVGASPRGRIVAMIESNLS